MVSAIVGNSSLSKGKNDYEPTPTDTEKFARMLEESSLGSEEARQARLDGARVLAEYSIVGSPWVHHAPPWPDIATVHQIIADLFEAEGQSEPSELWLRAAVNRKSDGPLVTQLAVLLEHRRATKEAVVWYQRAAELGDPVAAARLAVLCELKGNRDIATLLLSLGRSRMPRGRLVQADKLIGLLAKAGRRHRDKLIAECGDEDLLFWVGCVLLISDERDVAVECYSAAAMTKGHTVAALSLFDLTMLVVSDEEQDAVADVQSISDRFTEAIKPKLTKNVTDFIPREDESKRIAGDDDFDGLIVSAVAGDRDAIERVLRWIRPLVVRYCRARVRNMPLADEIAQEVCLSVLTALPSYRSQGRPFLSLVYGIASHKVADVHRAAARNRAESVPEIPDTQDLTDGPEQRAMQGELTERVNKLLETLPAREREIILLRFITGLSVAETAKVVGLTISAVYAAQRRALDRLRKMMTFDEML
jgi:RNA polymerase sigma-70 factor (ECF subfamily)